MSTSRLSRSNAPFLGLVFEGPVPRSAHFSVHFIIPFFAYDLSSFIARRRYDEALHSFERFPSFSP